MLTEEDLQKIDALLTRRVDAAVAHNLGIFAEDVQHRFQLLGEGQQALGEKLERVEGADAAQASRIDAALAQLIRLESELRKADAAQANRVDATVIQLARLESALHKSEATQTNRIDAAVAHGLGIFAEDVQHRFELLGEGQQALGEKLERVEEELRREIRQVDQRVLQVAVDLAAHRADTEVHRGVYGVRES